MFSTSKIRTITMFVFSTLGYYQCEDEIVGRDSSVGVVSGYRLYGPGIEFW